MKKLLQSLRLGFTLVELLVVVAIIALLAALLFPALGKVRQRADTLTCANNLHQLMLGIQLYTHDWQDYLGGYGWVNTTTFTNNSWAQPTIVTQGLLYPYLNSTKVFLCPTFLKTYQLNPSVANLTPYCSYSMNGYLWGSARSYPNPKIHLNIVQKAEELAILADEGTVLNTNYATCTINDNTLCPGTNLTFLIDCVAGFHNSLDPLAGVGNVAFGDGHIEQLRPSQTYTNFTPAQYR